MTIRTTTNETPTVHCAHDALVPTAELKANPRNPNKHPEKQIALLAKIIAAQGWRALVNADLALSSRKVRCSPKIRPQQCPLEGPGA